MSDKTVLTAGKVSTFQEYWDSAEIVKDIQQTRYSPKVQNLVEMNAIICRSPDKKQWSFLDYSPDGNECHFSPLTIESGILEDVRFTFVNNNGGNTLNCGSRGFGVVRGVLKSPNFIIPDPRGLQVYPLRFERLDACFWAEMSDNEKRVADSKYVLLGKQGKAFAIF
jgi:hypothetical protein